MGIPAGPCYINIAALASHDALRWRVFYDRQWLTTRSRPRLMVPREHGNDRG